MKPASIILFITQGDLLTNYTCSGRWLSVWTPWGGGVSGAIGTAWDVPTALRCQPCHSHTSKTGLSDAGARLGEKGEEKKGSRERRKGCPVPAIYSLSLEKTVQQADLLPHLPPGSLEGKRALRQDLEGINCSGRGGMKNQLPKEEIPG